MDIHSFIRAQHINTLVEIGAHWGDDTRIFRKSHPNARIIAFEPDPRNIAVLRKNAVDQICELYQYALSNTNGKQIFHLSSGYVWYHPDKVIRESPYSCSSSLKRPTEHLVVAPAVKFVEDILVDCVRLDDFVPLKDNPIDFIWADVQGAEDLVFSGAIDTLKRTRFVYTEYATNLYDGQLSRDQLIKLFGDDWSLIYDFGDGINGDILLKNTTL